MLVCFTSLDPGAESCDLSWGAERLLREIHCLLTVKTTAAKRRARSRRPNGLPRPRTTHYQKNRGCTLFLSVSPTFISQFLAYEPPTPPHSRFHYVFLLENTLDDVVSLEAEQAALGSWKIQGLPVAGAL